MSLVSMTVLSFYIVAAVSLLLISGSPALKALLFPYGKTLSHTASQHWLVHPLLVPKRWFSHFYIVGFSSSSSILLWYLVHSETKSLPWATFLFQLHTARRLFECLFVSKTLQSSQMHLSHYIIGLCFYLVTTLALDWENLEKEWPAKTHVVRGLGLLLFVYASFEQYLAHSYLASQRTGNSKKQQYILPNERWFRLLPCPHYLFEIVLYVGLALVSQTLLAASVLVWVITDLYFAQEQQLKWYKTKFGKNQIPRYWNLL